MNEALKQIYERLGHLECWLNQNLTPEKRAECQKQKRELLDELKRLKGQGHEEI